MTTPTLVFFGYDTVPRLTPKVYLRTLLYSTSARGKVIEGMYVKLSRDGQEQVFSFWGYGETNKLSPGSGLYVGQTGVAANHHFVLSMNHPGYAFVAGNYTITVFAQVVGWKSAVELAAIHIRLSEELAAVLAAKNGVLFERSPNDQSYVGHASERPQ